MGIETAGGKYFRLFLMAIKKSLKLTS